MQTFQTLIEQFLNEIWAGPGGGYIHISDFERQREFMIHVHPMQLNSKLTLCTRNIILGERKKRFKEPCLKDALFDGIFFIRTGCGPIILEPQDEKAGKYAKALSLLLEEIESSRKVSIGGINDTYECHFDRDRITQLRKDLTEGRIGGGK